MKKRSVVPVTLLLTVLCATAAFAGDIYVSTERGANKKGEGTIESPYKNIEWAVEQAESGDVIHVAAGYYPGVGRRGHWEVKKNNLTFLAGYTDDFSGRDPFVNVTLLAWDDSDANKTTRFPGPEFQATEDEGARYAQALGGIVIDGFTIDGAPRNKYREEPENPSLKLDETPNDALLHVALEQGTTGIIRNCTFLNSGEGPGAIVQARPGARVEIYNNVFANCLYHHVDIGTKQDKAGNRADFDVHHNTFVFAWKVSTNGSGVYVRPYTNASVHDNILAWGDMYALRNSFYEKKLNERGVPIEQGLANEAVAFDNNLLYAWQRGLYGWVTKGQSGELATVVIEDLEDTSLASAEDNQVADPGFDYNAEWMKLFVNRQDASEGQVGDDLINAIRAAFGLPLLAEASGNRQGYAMRYPLADVMKFRQPGAAEAQGRGATMELMVAEPGQPAMAPLDTPRKG